MATPSICVVGNSNHIKGKGLGEQIDSHDIVVRKGFFTEQKFAQDEINTKDFGTKITDWYVGSWEIFNFYGKDGKYGSEGQHENIAYLERQIEFFCSCEGAKNIYTFGGPVNAGRQCKKSYNTDTPENTPMSWRGRESRDYSLPVDAYNKFKKVIGDGNKKGSVKFYGDGTKWLPNLSLRQPFPDIRCTSIFFPHGVVSTNGLYILMKYLADNVTEKQKKINIAGFGFGGDKKASREWEAIHNPTHSPITEWKIIDMFIDAGRINNLEKGYLYR
jgi:hypothetical protein